MFYFTWKWYQDDIETLCNLEHSFLFLHDTDISKILQNFQNCVLVIFKRYDPQVWPFATDNFKVTFQKCQK